MFDVVAEAIRTRLTPASARTQGQRATGLLNTDPRRALIAAEAIHDRFPESPDALETWAEVNWRRGLIEEASKAYERLSANVPDRALGWLGCARVARAEGRHALQNSMAQQALERDPDSEEARALLADSLDDAPRLPPHGKLPLVLRDGRPFVDIGINGQIIPALLDSTASGIILALHDLPRFDLTTARHLTIGSCSLEDVDIKVMPFPEAFRFPAVLGLDLFRHHAIEVDLEAGEFRWMPSDATGQGGPLWRSAKHWIIPARIDEEAETLAIATASPDTLLDDRLHRGEPMRGVEVPHRHVFTLDGQHEVFYAPRTFLEGHRFELFHDAMTVSALPGILDTDWHPAGLLGLDVIRHLRLDFPARRAVVISR